MGIFRSNSWLLILSLQAVSFVGMAQSEVVVPEGRAGKYVQSTPVKESIELSLEKETIQTDGAESQAPLSRSIFFSACGPLTPWLIISMVLGLLLAMFGWYRYQLKQFKAREKLKTAFEKKLAHVEMSALLAQMNPHFLFNSLNSIESYIVSNQTKAAAQYLNNFSRLMRLILQHSRSNYISLKEEINALELYLEMEHIRFKNKFQYGIYIARDLDTDVIDIPPMLIQPYVENAIWHGLMHKPDRSNGMLILEISRKEDLLYCVIEDNGIGRKKAQAISARKCTPRKRSMGMAITQDRMKIMSQLYNFNTEVKVTDLYQKNGQPSGTRVELLIPI